MITRGSRYEYATVGFVKDAMSYDEYPVLFYTFDKLGTLTYTEHIWNDGDRLDILASSSYQSAVSWWMIMEHNPEITDPLNIPSGTVLRIPRAS